ncbi:Succinate--CoA ligase (ADP-forming) [[Leptolyngbya] sp. PCC 7376]|uniref:ATP-grasp domain-containing protein n=1 Tax=[Leptolyngbya] sp. PCC 7376 TaxID=111781 RepID=UPI00029F284A|nr:ATP-grasp domain-containing protein [[Leptolyngbya] sp. PCC 7376]AFY37623.1 Succinate--CoA ligase (ADP-forming) [[Leptolyngbya] sp. PCC 7376]
MELLEYQAKQLFRQVGIPTLPSQVISDARELKQLQIPYPVVLKSQVSSGGRGKVGGIKSVQNTIDAIAAARNIFNLAIAGQYPEVILAEAQYRSEQEIFLAVVLDYELQRPVLIGSAFGDTNVDVNTLLANLHQVVIEGSFSPFYARHLLHKMGVSGELVISLSQIIQKMYELLLAKDLELIEINPLGIGQNGELMALGGKVLAHNTALRKHADIAKFGDRSMSDSPRKMTATGPLFWKHDVTGGKIGIICVGVGAAALIWDTIHDQKGHPACCWILGPYDQSSMFVPQELETQMMAILEQVKSLPQVDVLLLNLVADDEINQQILQHLATYIKQPSPVINRAPMGHQTTVTIPTVSESTFPEVVVRCLPTIENTFDSSLYWETELSDAISRAIALSKQRNVRA